MLSKKTRYALQALMVMAEKKASVDRPVLISEVSEAGNIPLKFLESILLELKNKGLLQSKKGKGGGYFFQKAPEEIFFGQVIRVLEGPIALLPCVSQMAYQRCAECTDEATCGIRLLFKEVRDSSAKILDSTSLAKVYEVEAQLKKNQLAQPMYFI